MAIVGVGLICTLHSEAVLKDSHTELACIADAGQAVKAVAERLDCLLFGSMEQVLDQSISSTGNSIHSMSPSPGRY